MRRGAGRSSSASPASPLPQRFKLLLLPYRGSIALLGDTLHNVADALTAIPLLIAFTLAKRAATKRYTYGFGRAEDLAGLFVVAMIALSSAVAA